MPTRDETTPPVEERELLVALEGVQVCDAVVPPVLHEMRHKTATEPHPLTGFRDGDDRNVQQHRASVSVREVLQNALVLVGSYKWHRM
jgi:hypothetical protein